jgi:cell division protease FtsH
MTTLLIGFFSFLLWQPSNAFFYHSKKMSKTLFSFPVREPRGTFYKSYPLSRNYHEHYLKRLNSKNVTMQTMEILKGSPLLNYDEEDDEDVYSVFKNNESEPGYKVVLNKKMFDQLSKDINENFQNKDEEEEDLNERGGEYYDLYGNKVRTYGRRSNKPKNTKSDNFEVITRSPYNFTDVGGYDKIKSELYQCLDILTNYSKYEPYNVRIPKGMILEGPPGNGKTLFAKALAGEAGIGFIPVSGSEFQDKYVGVGSGRVRELFKLAKENAPCIIFIDEIDALGRKRSSDGDSSGNERDSTLNELLIALDGFKDSKGVFVLGATNRVDLLDNALTRPGRIDKRIYIGNPDSATRKAILDIHSKGKPHDDSVIIDNVVDITNGLSGAQIENLLNEAMLNSLRNDRQKYTNEDLDEVINKIIGGWQPNEHTFTYNMIEQIAIHELGHAVVGIYSEHHSKMSKVVINLSSPKTPAYTVFENDESILFTREALFEHLAILLAGRIAEEVFYDVSVTTGAINDFEEALKLAQKMICYYGMGKQLIYPNTSEKYKEMIDSEVASLISEAYAYSENIVRNSKDLITEGVDILMRDKVLKYDTLIDLQTIIEEKYLQN